jgi:sporulation protein YlmC with PRC-barrel domain
MTYSRLAAIVFLLSLLAPNGAPAQVAGSTVFGLDVVELRQVAIGWSAKHQILGKAVYNDKSEQIGKIDDIIIAPDRAVSYAIVGVGGFLGVARHDVAVSVSRLKVAGDKLVLAGATKEALKATPAFEYAHSPH